MKKANNHTVTIKGPDDIVRKLEESYFFLTINSNKVVQSMDDPYVKEFKNEMKTLLTKLFDYIKVNYDRTPDDSMIIVVEHHFEIGAKQHRLHMHSGILVRHDSNIHIDYDKIRDRFPGFHVHGHYVKAWQRIKSIVDYLRKSLW